MVRLIHALDLVRSDKAEAVALEVGYRSKKNFYATLKRDPIGALTGLKSAGFFDSHSGR